jgi:hypothetical protein
VAQRCRRIRSHNAGTRVDECGEVEYSPSRHQCYRAARHIASAANLLCMTDEELRKLAKRRLTDQANFKYFLWIWFGVSALLVGIWAITSWTAGEVIYFWPAWAIGGMGVAAFFMGLAAYGPQVGPVTESAIDAEVERIKGKSAPKL